MPGDRRLAAIMFTDIVGYTALMGSDEDKAFKVLRKNREIQRPIIKKYNGKWLKEMGDGILASFNTASDAVRCAGDIQKVTKKEGIGLRIGIHEGEVVFEGGDVLGDGVNVASRLEELAESGTINISGAVYKDIKNKAGIAAEYIGEKILKNVDDPVKVYKVRYEEEDRKKDLPKWEETTITRNKLPYFIIGGLLVVTVVFLIWLFLPAKEKEPQTTNVLAELVDKSIAVLPFRNDSPDPDNEYFCNGVVEEILTHLQKIEDLNVKSRTSSEQYRNPGKELMMIAKELGVAFILEGSVRKVGDDIRITVQLIEAKSDNHLWAETFDGKYTEEIFEFQSNTAKKVAASLQAVITPSEALRIEQKPTSDMLAYDFMTRGHEMIRTWRWTRDRKNLEIALNLINQALEIDPAYMEALYQKANLYMEVGNYDSAMYNIDKRIELDPNSGHPYVQKGVLYMIYLDKPDSAYKYLIKGLELNPNHCWTNLAMGQFYFFCKYDIINALPYYQRAYQLKGESAPEVNFNIGYIYWSIGDYPKAEKYFTRALQLRQECNLITWNDHFLYYQGRYDEAVQFLDSMCRISACEQICDIERFHIYTLKKEFEQAEKHYIKAIEAGYQPHTFDYISIAYLYKETGRENEDLALLQRSIQRDDNALVSAASERIWLSLSNIYLAAANAILGENEEALRYLSESEKFGFYSGYLDLILIHPAFENLKDIPEFKALVERAQDEKTTIRAQIKEMEENGNLVL
jgi:TolB-like protein/class 3 adenylate cyclase/Tfp pilus assembly protein PilF